MARVDLIQKRIDEEAHATEEEFDVLVKFQSSNNMNKQCIEHGLTSKKITWGMWKVMGPPFKHVKIVSWEKLKMLK